MATNKLTAKAAKLDFSGLPGVGTSESPTPAAFVPRPKTAPGAMMAFANDTRSELLKENEDLRSRAQESEVLRSRLDEVLGDLQQWNGAKATRLLDPARVTGSRYANRHEQSFQGPDFARLKGEIQDAGGNVQPIKVRSVAGSDASDPQYEIVFGHRRHRACLDLGLPVLAVVDNLDDRTLFVEMERENRGRKDLSAWEQGMMYRRALDLGLFPSNRKLAEAIGVDLSALGKALALAALPDKIVEAFPSPLSLQFRWARPLADAFAGDPDGVLKLAAELASLRGKASAREVFEQLVGQKKRGVEPFHPPGPIAVQTAGRRARIEAQANGAVTVAIDPNSMTISQARLQMLAAVIEKFLAEER